MVSNCQLLLCGLAAYMAIGLNYACAGAIYALWNPVFARDFKFLEASVLWLFELIEWISDLPQTVADFWGRHFSHAKAN